MDCGGRDEDLPEELLRNITYISPNETELLRIDSTLDTKNLTEEIRTKLLAKYPNLRVLLKQGSRGSAIVTKTVYIECPTPNKVNKDIGEDYHIIDTVGAGDCFTAAYAVKHAELDWSDSSKDEENYYRAMEFGNCSAFLCITKKGAMPSMPARKEVD